MIHPVGLSMDGWSEPFSVNLENYYMAWMEQQYWVGGKISVERGLTRNVFSVECVLSFWNWFWYSICSFQIRLLLGLVSKKQWGFWAAYRRPRSGWKLDDFSTGGWWKMQMSQKSDKQIFYNALLRLALERIVFCNRAGHKKHYSY